VAVDRDDRATMARLRVAQRHGVLTLAALIDIVLKQCGNAVEACQPL
jgi:hypothetical protein